MEKILVVYWSATGNTEAMAQAIADGINAGGASADLVPVSENPDVSQYQKIAFGCPAMGCENLEEGEFEPYFTECEDKLAGKKIALFGSYDWGTCEWMTSWIERVNDANGIVFKEGLTVNLSPDDDALSQCEEYGKEFVEF